MNDVLSVLIPTRDRSQPLEASVRLLRHLARRPERVEILLRADDDDPVDYERDIWPLFSRRGESSARGRVIRGPRHGYVGIHHYFNELAKMSVGRWCLVWSDDAYIATPGWDEILEGVRREVAVAWLETNHGVGCFPAFTQRYFEVVGHASLTCHTDSWLEEVSQAAGVRVDVPILVLHAYFPEHLRQKSPQTSIEYGNPAMVEARRQDAEKLRRHMRNTG